MPVLSLPRPLAIAAVAGAGFCLAACSGTTYGTGTSPGMQTLTDVAGIVAMGGEKKEPIDYKPRAKIVAPPTTASLPPPGSGDATAFASNWPNDPDVEARRLKAEQEARYVDGPPTADKDPTNLPSRPRQPGPAPELVNNNKTNYELAHTTDAQNQAAKEISAKVKGNLSVDANGNPVRTYLTEPPTDYRVPDPSAPTEYVDAPKKKKKFRWPWSSG